MTKKDRTNLIIIAAVLIIIIALGWLVVARNRVPSTVLGNSDTETGAATQNAGSDTLSVKDQSAGSSVEVASMKLTAESWVAIKDEKGWILGAARFAPAAVSGTVPLLRATVPGKTYTAVIFSDNGDKAFDFHTDTLVDGVSTSFVAQ